MMKTIYFDFETTGIDPTICRPIQGSFLFCEDGKIVDKITAKIRVNTFYHKLSKEEQDGLAFNNICNQWDLTKHNENAVLMHTFISDLMTKVSYFTDFKVSLTGWNCAGFDAVILRKMMHECGYTFEQHFDYHIRDLMHRFHWLYEIGYLRGLSLKMVHLTKVGSINVGNFHDAETDCYAVRDLDKWYSDFMNERTQMVEKEVIPR
jgi:exonuclease I